MTDIEKPVSPDLTNATAQAFQINEHIAGRTKILSAEQRAQLSQALFPETHTDKVMLVGKERTITPLPVKVSRKLNNMLQGLQAKLEEGEGVKVVEVNLIDSVLEVGLCLSEFYNWEDVTEAIKEEEVMLPELQALIVMQLTLQEMNDFLLMPLRLLVGVMQQAEIEMMNMQNIFSGLA